MDISSVEKEGRFRASKWIRHAVLLSVEQMQELILDSFLFFVSGQIVPQGEEQISKDQFLGRYAEYIASKGRPQASLKRALQLFITSSLDPLYKVEIQNQCMVKERLPVIQLIPQSCFFSLDGNLVFGVSHQNGFSFGLQFSYPQVYEHPHTHQFHKVFLESGFPNSADFKKILQWIRSHTEIVRVKGSHVPLRIGKKSKQLLENHPLFEV